MRKVLAFLLVGVVVLSVAGTALAADYWPWSVHPRQSAGR